MTITGSFNVLLQRYPWLNYEEYVSFMQMVKDFYPGNGMFLTEPNKEALAAAEWYAENSGRNSPMFKGDLIAMMDMVLESAQSAAIEASRPKGL